jgi:hypothetical protein
MGSVMLNNSIDVDIEDCLLKREIFEGKSSMAKFTPSSEKCMIFDVSITYRKDYCMSTTFVTIIQDFSEFIEIFTFEICEIDRLG